MSLQNSKKGTERVQTKLGKTHVDYWHPRLRKRFYTGRDSVVHEVPDYQVRIKHLGRSAWFNLKTSNRTDAAFKARDVYIFLIANGWEAALNKFKPQAEKPQNLTVNEFADVYRKKIELVEYPPLKRTVERYISCLLYICSLVKVRNIARLTTQKIKKFKLLYLKRGRDKGRDEDCIKITCNSHLRGAASLYSKQMLEEYKDDGIELANPFHGQRLRRIEIKPYTPLRRELLDEIWRDSIKLRDGDPDAPAPPPRNKGGRPKINQAPVNREKKCQRWKEPDWRKPHPEAYKILLLELGIGLRREESDKAEWDWMFISQDGRRCIEVRKTEFFTPKGKRRRILPVEEVLWDAILQTRGDLTRFIVPGKMPIKYTRETEPKGMNYRCEKHHRTLTAWLRKKGIKDSKPCHLLRKEFGSYVATAFGLFVAQRLLGHSSPSVTEAFYAGLTNLPELNHVKIQSQQ